MLKSIPIAVRGTTDEIAGRLRAEIEAGTLPPDAPLNQVDLAARFGMSRIPVREALRQLEAEGYVTYRTNKGATVATSLSVPELLEVLEIRHALESVLMRHVVEHIDEATLKRARAALERMNTLYEIKDLRGKHAQFHTLLFEAARRPRMAAMINEWRFRYDNRAGDEGARLRGFVHDTSGVHDRLLEACAHRDAAAVQRCVDEEYEIVRASLTRV